MTTLKPKPVRISWKYFSWIVGYGLWCLATIGLLLLLVSLHYEYESVFVTEYGDDCYKQFLSTVLCSNRDIEQYIEEKQMVVLILLIMDAMACAFWIYYKQQYFKFEWSCFND